MLPSKDQLTISFAHVAYRLRERFLARPASRASRCATAQRFVLVHLPVRREYTRKGDPQGRTLGHGQQTGCIPRANANLAAGRVTLQARRR